MNMHFGRLAVLASGNPSQVTTFQLWALAEKSAVLRLGE